MSVLNTRNQRQWWLEGGFEICFSCEQSYALEMERRCAHCDAPLCPLCATARGDEVVCEDCCRNPAG